MKIALFVASAAVAMFMGASAQAAVIAIDTQGASNSQLTGPVLQAGLSAAIAVGDVQDYSDLAADLTNVANVNSVEMDAKVDGVLLGASSASAVNSQVANLTTQLGAAVTGSGGLSNNSTSMAGVLNGVNINSAKMTVVVK